MIEIRNLTKTYGKITAVEDVSFDVKTNAILGFLGPNGAGKSTVMNIITGFLSPTSGTVKIDGIDVTENSLETRKKIGYLPELPPLYGDMTVYEYLNFVAGLKGVKGKAKKEQLENIMTITQISDKKNRLVRNLSKGYRQRVGFAQALVGDPEILILDEPTVGLDPRQVVEFRKIITTLGRNHTIILSTHILQEVSAICSDVVIIDKGNIVRSSSLKDFTTTIKGEKRYFVTLEGTREAAENMLNQVEGIKLCQFARMEQKNVVFRVTADGDAEINRAIFFAAAKANMPILELKSVEKTLEEEYMNIILNGREKEEK